MEMDIEMDTNMNMNMDMDKNKDKGTGTDTQWIFKDKNVGNQISVNVYFNVRRDVRLIPLESDTGGSDIRLSLVSCILDVGLIARQPLNK
jgi:hypothetical protein